MSPEPVSDADRLVAIAMAPPPEPERTLFTEAPVTLLDDQSAVDRITRQLLLDLREQAADAGLVLGDGPIELMVTREDRDDFFANRVTVRAEATARPPRCGQDGRHEVPETTNRPASCPCGAVTRIPRGTQP